MPPNGTMKLAELAARAEPTADNGGKNAAKWDATQGIMAVNIPPKCTMTGIAG